ncbi:regulator of nonsense transcripts 3A [Photinus pyralis]|uniref:UPF3 domain-containing protein n=1 Tax=Photinus pyralis TaxID=7054 RepID=A0A1Y1LDD1_PHOPY|nr:regulator of nonsense transcripts 3A [Photinus pyralis]
MAVSDGPNASCEDKTYKDIPKSKDKKEKPLTKVIVRRLPPSIDLQSFLMQVSPIPDYDYIYIVRGDMSFGEHAFGRVYINFVQPTDIFMFKEKFDNYVFVDQKGHEYPAVVEFASFQKIPRKRKPRLDPKVGSIESDPIYLEFVESLKEQPNQDIKPEFSYQFGNDTKEEISSTPLLDYIKQRRIDKQRIREERREERKRKELERKKLREDERKRYEQKSPAKVASKPVGGNRSTKTALDSLKEEEKHDAKIKEEDTPQLDKSAKEDSKGHFKLKPRFPTRSEKVDYHDKRSEYKNRRDDYREKEFRSRRFEEYKNEPDFKAPRRTKKYSEKREERRNEARKAELKIVEEIVEKPEETDNMPEGQVQAESTEGQNEEAGNVQTDDMEESSLPVEHKLENQSSTEFDDDVSLDKESKCKEHDPRLQRRIRNKDRPTMAIYQPGMLSKRKTTDDDTAGPKE